MELFNLEKEKAFAFKILADCFVRIINGISIITFHENEVNFMRA